LILSSLISIGRRAVATLFGIKNCDTIKKARRWLDDQNIEYHFHDLRADGLTLKQINQWIEKSHWETLLNKRGTTWRKLDTTIKDTTNRDNVADLLLNNPAMIKRPVLDHQGTITIGYAADTYKTIFVK
jgi:arsenate reductase